MTASHDAVVRLDFHGRPRAWRYMASAFYPSPGLKPGQRLPDIAARWTGYRAGKRELADFERLAGAGANAGRLPLLYPHVIGFRLQMALLTHPAFPVPIWGVLQVRNRLLQHRAIGSDEVLGFETRVHAHRVVEKGLEIDLHTAVTARDGLAWESVNTFYVRGRFGPPGAASAFAQAPCVGAEVVASWHMPAAEGWRFGALTGDYNGIHLWNRYARWLGFRSAFFHPQRVLGQCLARLGAPTDDKPVRMEAWLKGPVYHGSHVRLCSTPQDDGLAFAVFAGDETRPGIIGRFAHAHPGVGLVDAADTQ